MKTFLLTAVACLAFAVPALANQCPMMMGEIEAALATSTADEATKATATALLEEGRALHEAGDHAASEAKLAEAMALLGV
jgi:hypothetical protein